MGKEQELIKENLFDIRLPYDSLSLLLIVKSLTDRRNFLKSRTFVLTNPGGMEEGAYAHLGISPQVGFRHSYVAADLR